MADGTGTIDFGASPTDEATLVITGQTGIVSGSHVEAFFMRETATGNGVDEHEDMATFCRLVCGNIVGGTGFTIYANMIAGWATGLFSIRWVWK